MRAFMGGLVIALLLSGPVATARAQRRLDASTEAKAHYELGMTAYGVGHFDRAIEAFTRAYKLDPAPILLFNIAQALRKKGDRDQAITYYRRYLDGAPGAEDRETVLARIRELEAEPKVPDPKVAVVVPETGAPATPPGDPQPGSNLASPLAPAAPPPGPSDRLVDAPEIPPIHRRPWFWQVVGAAALVTVATILLVRPDRPWSCGPPDCNLPTRTVE
jgi:tetratricopeptide (TPR) repeat protein